MSPTLAGPLQTPRVRGDTAACSMQHGDMWGHVRVVSGHPGHGTPELVAGERQCWRQQGPAQWTMGWWWWVQLHSRQTLDTAAAHTPPYQGGIPSKRYNYRVSLRPSVTTARDSLSGSPHITHGSADSLNPVAGGWYIKLTCVETWRSSVLCIIDYIINYCTVNLCDMKAG